MTKATLTTILLLVFCGSVFSQSGTIHTNESPRFLVRNITYGGTLGASFTTNTSAVTIAPQVGYNFTDWFNAGVGISYSYLNFRDNTFNEKNHYLGFNIYGRATIMQHLLVHAQPELNHVWWTTEDRFTGEKISGTAAVPSFIVGAGFRQQNVYAMFFYDVVQNRRSPYGKTIGYSVGFWF